MLESAHGLLRAWRLAHGWTQAHVGAIVSASVATVSTWETGVRRIPHDALERLDAAYGADGCLVDLTYAIGTPRGFWTTGHTSGPQPRRYWNFVQRESAPRGLNWVWIRPGEGDHVRGYVYSGILGHRIDQAVGPEGIFITTPTHNKHWPLHVVLAEPGWADVGHGTPPAWLDRPVRQSLDWIDIEVVNSDDLQIQFYIDEFQRRDQGDPATLTDRLRAFVGPDRWDRFETTWRRAVPLPTEARVNGVPDAAHPPTSGRARRALHRRLRQARGLSQTEAAAGVTALLDGTTQVSVHQIHNYEIGRASRVPYLPALLDVVYRASGWSCFEAVDVALLAPGHFEIAFPEWWTGPVCIEARRGPGRPPLGTMQTTWKRWTRRYELTATSRKFTFCRVIDDPPLRVDVPLGWNVTAHIGHSSDALDANDDWFPVDEAAGRDIFDEYVGEWLTLVGLDPADFQRALEG